MLAYAGKSRASITPLKLNELVRGSTELLTVSISKHAKLQLELAAIEPIIECDPNQIRQVLMNLIINASDAIGEQPGVIEIQTSFHHGTEPVTPDDFRCGELPPGESVCLSVRDTGSGMSSDLCRRIFEPFFTTKFAGRGLGLAAVLGIVQSHRGAIGLQSVVARGTLFRIWFPKSRGMPETSSTSTAAPIATRIGKVLVVDDEDAIRKLCVRMLERVGYTVIVAESGEDGVKHFANNRDIVTAIVDLTMPGWDGVRTLTELRAIDPKVRVIFSSGYGESELMRRVESAGANAFLAKPFSLDTLRRVLVSVTSE
jgi:two-component system, cell cycle sensor histidine kinase and response regulator CckA